MTGLERISPHPAFRKAPAGRLRHSPVESLPRHVHCGAFAAVVISGGYIEAGDTGRHSVSAGDVLLHQAYESHLDRFARAGAEVLILPLPLGWQGPSRAVAEDPDQLARLAERGGPDLHMALADGLLKPRPTQAVDWPDLLAQALAADPGLVLADWADGQGVRLGSLSRGFRQAYGTTPAAYRLAQRTRRAVQALLSSCASLADLAQAAGFADQSHMTRAVVAHTGETPRRLRLRGLAAL